MSLLLGVRDWITFDEALMRASRQGAFEDNLHVGSWGTYALDKYRLQLLKALASQSVSVRFFKSNDTVLVDPMLWMGESFSSPCSAELFIYDHIGKSDYFELVLSDSLIKHDEVMTESGELTADIYISNDEHEAPGYSKLHWLNLFRMADRLEVYRPGLDEMLSKASGATKSESVEDAPAISHASNKASNGSIENKPATAEPHPKSKAAYLRTIYALSCALIDKKIDQPHKDAGAVLAALSKSKIENGIAAPIGDAALANYLSDALRLQN